MVMAGNLTIACVKLKIEANIVEYLDIMNFPTHTPTRVNPVLVLGS